MTESTHTHAHTDTRRHTMLKPNIQCGWRQGVQNGTLTNARVVSFSDSIMYCEIPDTAPLHCTSRPSQRTRRRSLPTVLTRFGLRSPSEPRVALWEGDIGHVKHIHAGNGGGFTPRARETYAELVYTVQCVVSAIRIATTVPIKGA
jgi:hypothetical protein